MDLSPSTTFKSRYIIHLDLFLTPQEVPIDSVGEPGGFSIFPEMSNFGSPPPEAGVYPSEIIDK